MFEFDRAELTLTAQQDLETLAALIRATDGPVSIHGDTDTGASTAYRQALSERRALAVRDWLTGRGVPAGRLRAQGFDGDGPPVTGEPDAQDGPRDRIAVVIGRD
nr:OmpA family protein [Coralloluteibacterium stylophorae]